MSDIFAGFFILLFFSFGFYVYWLHDTAFDAYHRALKKQNRKVGLSGVYVEKVFFSIFGPMALLVKPLIEDLKKHDCSEVQSEIEQIEKARKSLALLFTLVLGFGPFFMIILVLITKSLK